MANEKRNRQRTAKRPKGNSFGKQLEHQTRLSVIISVQQNEKTIKQVIKQAERLRPKEMVLIVHGSCDRSVDLLFQTPACDRTCYIYPFPLGEEAWRPIGAKEATGEVWLFLSGDTVIPAEELLPFIRACDCGVDIALRKESLAAGNGTVTLAKTYLNSLTNQEALGFASMSELPFAITREAASRIGLEHLLVPPLAQVVACEKGLRVEAVHRPKEVEKGKQKRPLRTSKMRELTRLGDHLEAVEYWSGQNQHGP